MGSRETEDPNEEIPESKQNTGTKCFRSTKYSNCKWKIKQRYIKNYFTSIIHTSIQTVRQRNSEEGNENTSLF